ncbi:heavy-metal-associated domain-containing protein [Cardiobacterium valvarum]|uniref:Putative mercuric reductase n=1 Tax=Cardiobacterium valvarum TaxID=194702 RepID=A0A381DXP9_9GAMM|nr:heavy-metal-associated domain-containing protein [Cardiobacterium valvarum]SUX17888.1 putative mercuric reductase [Cardiobacterium valvarum]
MQHITLNIDGMNCNGCVASVTKILQGVDGVVSATVSLADKRAEVAFDAAKTSPEALIAAVEDGGYDASL